MCGGAHCDVTPSRMKCSYPGIIFSYGEDPVWSAGTLQDVLITVHLCPPVCVGVREYIASADEV